MPTRQSVFAAVAALFIAATSLPAAGQTYGESAADFVQPRLTRTQLGTLLDALSFDRDQRTIAESIYSGYAAQVNAAIERADAAADQAGRATVEQALAGRVRVSVEQLREMRADVLRAYTTVWPEVDTALDELLSGIEALSTPAQHERARDRMLALRRELYLAPRRANAYSSDYAGEGVNVLQLIEDARADGGELASVSQRQLAPLRDQYEKQLDAMLEDTSSQLRAARVNQRIAQIRRDDRARRIASAQMLQAWQRVYDLNRRTVKAIGEMIQSPEGRQQWQQRFDRACFPWLLEDDVPDRQYAWLLEQNLAPEIRSQIEQAYQHYTQRHRAVAQSMIELIVQARLTLAVPLHPMMDPTDVPDQASDLYEQLLKLTGEQQAATNRVLDTFQSLITETQRRAMRRALR